MTNGAGRSAKKASFGDTLNMKNAATITIRICIRKPLVSWAMKPCTASVS